MWLFQQSPRTVHAWTLWFRNERALADSIWDVALAAARRELADGHDGPTPSFEIAAISAARGDTAAALSWLERSYRAGNRSPAILKRDPFFAGLRGNSQFRQLIERMEADLAEMRARARVLNDTLLSGGRD
jgi:hypothetical protein